MYKIRFHLGRGENFMKWQVKNSEGITYYEPEKFQIAMFNAKLKVQLGTSTKIHDGACKTVCAWVESEKIQVLGAPDVFKPSENDLHVRFNPRINPNWIDDIGTVINDDEFPVLVTNNRSIFALSENPQCDD